MEATERDCYICLTFLGKGIAIAREFAASDPTSLNLFWICEHEEHSESLPASALLIDIVLRAATAQGTLARRFLLVLKEGELNFSTFYCIRAAWTTGVLPYHRYEASSGINRPTNSSSTSSIAALNAAKTWLRNFRQNHVTCESAVPKDSR